jgi:Family of unknown function (DUF5681)
VSKKSRTRSPPNPGWFPKGRSGNPRGRPRGSRVTTGSAFEVLVERTFAVAGRGGTREITAEEALQQRIYQNALAGKAMAIRTVMKWTMEREAWRAKHETKAHKPTLLRISPDPDNADAALVLLGIAAPNPAREDMGADRAQLLLEPWAVQAALRRRRGGQRLTEQEVNDVRRRTRDPDTLRWPRGTGR